MLAHIWLLCCCRDGREGDTLLYSGASNEVSLDLGNSSRCVRLRVRAVSSTGQWGDFGAERSVALLPWAVPSLVLNEVKGGRVSLAWTPLSSSGCVSWYEVQLLNVAQGNATVLRSGLASMEVTDLEPLVRYAFAVRVCDAASCSSFSNSVSAIPSEDPMGPRAPEPLGFKEGIITVGWSAFPSAPLEPFLDSYEVFASLLAAGPYVSVGLVSASAEPMLSFACNETNATEWPYTFHVKVRSTVAAAWGSGAAESAARRMVCAPAPVAPAAPALSVERRTSRQVPGIFDLHVALSLAEQPPEVVLLHLGWRLELLLGGQRQVATADAAMRSYTFEGISAAEQVEVSYAVLASSGVGPSSPASQLRVNLGPLAPVLQVGESTNEQVSLSWTWQPGIDMEELLSFRLYVDWLDGHFSMLRLDQPFVETSLPGHVVNCSDVPLGTERRLRFQVAAVAAGGVGPLSPPALGFCSALPLAPAAPTLSALGDGWALLRWAVPELHGAPLRAAEVDSSEGSRAGRLTSILKPTELLNAPCLREISLKMEGNLWKSNEIGLFHAF